MASLHTAVKIVSSIPPSEDKRTRASVDTADIALLGTSGDGIVTPLDHVNLLKMVKISATV